MSYITHKETGSEGVNDWYWDLNLGLLYSKFVIFLKEIKLHRKNKEDLKVVVNYRKGGVDKMGLHRGKEFQEKWLELRL